MAVYEIKWFVKWHKFDFFRYSVPEISCVSKFFVLIIIMDKKKT